MEQAIKDRMMDSVRDFRLPAYDEIPDVGLYLEQTVKYINEYLAPLDEIGITASMVSNYVKMKLIASPVRKQYSRDQIAALIIITIAKSVVSLDNVRRIVDPAAGYDARRLYGFFAAEFRNLLLYVFDVKDVPDETDVLNGDDIDLVRNLILTAANKIYLDKCFAMLSR